MQNKLITELLDLIADVNPNEIASHIADGSLIRWTQIWQMKGSMLAGFINEVLMKNEEVSDDA